MTVDSPSTPELVIGLDLARHRSLCVARIDGERSIIPLAPGHRGLIMRWVDRNERKHRITDRLLELAGPDRPAAVAIARSVAECVFPESLPTRPYIAIPSAFGPACRAALLEGFADAGLPIDDQHLVERPVAAFASWLHHRRQLGSPGPIGPMLVLDNDGGQISAAAIDADARRIVFTTPLSAGPDEPAEVIIDRLHSVVRELDRLRSGHGLVRSDEWSNVSAAVSQVAVAGSMSEHPLFLDLLARVLPAAAIVRDPIIADQGDVVGAGLVSLAALADWSAGWPTLDLRVDDRLAVPAGDLDADALDVEITVPAKAALTLTRPDGSAVPLRVGSMLAEGLQLPRDLQGELTLRVLADGRVLVLGPAGVRPLTFSVAWPLIAEDQQPAVTVTAIGRRPLQLVNPTTDRSRRTTVA
ncbi:MAG: hypothetical protein R2733_03205 [Acidimicrobiales bacterium]